MKHGQKKLIKKLLQFFFWAPLTLWIIFLLKDSTINWLLLFIALLSLVLSEINNGEVIVGGRGSKIKKGKPGFYFILSFHILIVVGTLLMFLSKQFF